MSVPVVDPPPFPTEGGGARRDALAGFADTIAAFVDSAEPVVCITGRLTGRIDWVDASTTAAIGIAPGDRLSDFLSAGAERAMRALLSERHDVDRIVLSLVDAGRPRWSVAARLAFDRDRFLLIGERLSIALEPVLQARPTTGIHGAVDRSVRELRRALERDIHDSAQQKLLTVGLGLDLAAAAAADPALEQRLHLLRGQVSDALTDLRNIVHGRHPAQLETAGLAAALAEATRECPLPVSIVAPRVGRYSPGLESAVYYSCLEGVQNAVKHAQGTRVEIELEERGRALLFRVRDDGRGLPPGRARVGTGLIGVRDRLRAIGGRLRVVSAPGRGTTLSGSVPIAAGGGD